MIAFFAKTVNDLLFLQKRSIIDIWHGSKFRGDDPKVFCKKSVPANFGKITNYVSYVNCSCKTTFKYPLADVLENRYS